MAEYLLREMGKDRFEVSSAGTAPAGVNPFTLRVLNEVCIDASGARSKSLDEFTDREFDYVITVCDRAKDQCPIFPGDSKRIHWGFDDPASAAGDEAERLKVFRRVRTEISNRLRNWIPAVTR